VPPPVYSERFVYRSGPNGQTDYVVPAGKRAVVKDALCLNTSATTSNVILVVGPISVWIASVPGNYGFAHAASLTLVAYAGEKISIVTGVTGMNAMACGFLLTAP
jgi:hypothetical protein